MPYKYAQNKGWKIPKQKYKLKNWSKYSNALKDRGRIDFWLDKEVIENWYEQLIASLIHDIKINNLSREKHVTTYEHRRAY